MTTEVDEWIALRADVQSRINAEMNRRRVGRGSICDEKMARWRLLRDQAQAQIERLTGTGNFAK
jgi:hypothetical protein